MKPKFKVNDLVGIADLKNTFSKRDTDNWSCILYKNTEIINDIIPSYHIANIPERYKEALLKKTELSTKEKDSVMKKLNVNSIKSKCRCPSLLIETNLFVKTRAYPFLSLGTTPSNLDSTLIGWKAVKFCWYLISKTYRI